MAEVVEYLANKCPAQYGQKKKKTTQILGGACSLIVEPLAGTLPANKTN
jgi:hypothetical protein